MFWNWQQIDWPNFQWDQSKLQAYESKFLKQSGIQIGSTKHINENGFVELAIDLITDEALRTSEIEGEYLDRDSVQSSLRKNFGFDVPNYRIKPAEFGIAAIMTDLYENHTSSLNHELFFKWHKLLTNGRQDLKDIGSYRTHTDIMQVVSGRVDKPKVHFEAPPSSTVTDEMQHFIKWWNRTKPGSKNELTPLVRAGVAHLYFVCIHPFEDGNGRIGRALIEKCLSEDMGKPTLIAISQTIYRNKKDYYQKLEDNNKHSEITDWLIYFSEMVLEAQTYTIQLVSFLIEKTKLFDRLRNQINNRQLKVLERMFREGLEGFTGGLSAENYISITGTSRATASRDLADLLDKGAFIKTGQLKSTRYHLNVDLY